MKSYIPLLTAAVLALSACGSNDEPEVVGGPADPMAKELANAAPIELPPAVKDSRTYRCKDNSLLLVDYLADDKSVHVRLEKGAAPTTLKAPEAGQPFTAEGGYVIDGAGSSITATLPGKPAQSCKA